MWTDEKLERMWELEDKVEWTDAQRDEYEKLEEEFLQNERERHADMVYEAELDWGFYDDEPQKG